MSGVRRILHVISGLGMGGAETALLRLVNGMDRQRFRNAVLTLRDGPMRAPLIACGVDVMDAGLHGMRDLPRAWRALGRFSSDFEPHVVQGWMNHGNLAAMRARRAVGKRARLVWGIRQSLYDLRQEKRATRMVIRTEAALSRFPDAILFNSAVGLVQHKARGFTNARMHIIPNGFDTARFRPDEIARRDTRSQLHVPENAKLVGLIARYHAIKDFPMFFRAMARLLERREDVYALAVGTHVPALAPVVEQIVGRALAARVLLRDARTEVERLYPALDVVCSTSLGEGFPNVVAEAMSCGVPCVVTDAGDSAHLVGDSGIVVPRGDAENCANAVFSMLANDSDRAARGRRARDRIAEHFSIANMAASYSGFYDSLLEKDEIH